jgi:hypothetical protein
MKNIFSKLIILFALFALVILYFFEHTGVGMNVKKSMLSQRELWPIKYSYKIKERAWDGSIKDQDAFLALVKQAWQWDKNAMVHYAFILYEAEEQPEDRYITQEINDFLTKNKRRLVDAKGNLLESPELFEQPLYSVIALLADAGYPLASNYMRSRIRSNVDPDTLAFLPLSEEKRDLLVRYTTNALKGGFKLELELNDEILFPGASGYVDDNFSQMVRLSEHIETLSQADLQAAFNRFNAHALHGSSYAMIRMCEAYLHGVGIKQNDEMAYVWCALADKSYAEHRLAERDAAGWTEEAAETTLQNYNQELLKAIALRLDSQRQKNALLLLKQQEAEIITWDYAKWVSTLLDVPPQP